MKTLFKIILVCLAILVSFSWLTWLKYHISIMEYLEYTSPFTDKEVSYLEEKKALVYAADQKAPPLTFISQETGQTEGLLIDYMSALSIELGIEILYQPQPWDQVLTSVRQGEADMTDLFESPQRKEKFSFTQPLYLLRGVVVTSQNRYDLQSLDDIRGKTVAAIKDDYTEELLRENFFGKDEDDKVEIIAVSDVEAGLKLLSQGKADALAGDETVIDYYAAELAIEEEIKQVGEPLYEKNVALAVSKENQTLLNILDKGILNLKKKNILTQTQEKWFGSSAPVITDITSLNWIQAAVCAALLFLLLFLIWESAMERKIKEKTLEIQLQKDTLRTIIDNIHAILIVVDQKDRIIEYNQMAQALLLSEGTDLLGKDIRSFPLLTRLLPAGQQSASPLYTYKGRYYSVFQRDLAAAEKLRLLVIEDQTEQTLAERKLRQESKMIAVGQLSAGLAHEIRNPLGLIKSYAYILKDYANDEISSHSLAVIRESTDRINNLIENLLSFSRPGKDQASRFNMNKLLTDILALEQKELKKREITLQVHCPEDIFLSVNEESIKIILLNLISNSIDALSQQQKTLKILRLYVNADSQKVSVKISDTGPGIAEKDLENIFNPFFTTKETGTGLGLFLVSTELEKIGGAVSVDSRLGEGTTFTVIFPASHSSPAAKTTKQSE